ncbi:MAG: sugar ABC transporter permease [Clostridiales bacterium]|jgi:putative multiple sugar transport system permease protein|nr:sugar ABC transporter permease [Clostridiales bacterium]
MKSKGFSINLRQYGMIIALVFIIIMFGITTGGILFKPMNVSNIIMQNAYVLILAVGMLFCIITGNVDLSIGSVVAFVGAVSAVFMVNWNMPVWMAVVLSLLIGALVGAFQGFFIAYVKIPAFIVTLGGMLIFRGLTMVILKGQTIAPFDESFQFIASGFLMKGLKVGGLNTLSILGGALVSILFIFFEVVTRNNKIKYNFEVSPIHYMAIKIAVIVAAINVITYRLAQYNGLPIILIIMALLIIIYSFVAGQTIAGRHVYALGGNEKAAKLSGIKTQQVMFWVYTNMGLLSAFAGLVVAGRLNAATPKAGNGYELDAIAACYIGGASASGGIGTIVGAIVGGLVMGVLNNGMSIMGVSVDWQQVIKGFVLLTAVTFDIYSRSKSSPK